MCVSIPSRIIDETQNFNLINSKMNSRIYIKVAIYPLNTTIFYYPLQYKDFITFPLVPLRQIRHLQVP